MKTSFRISKSKGTSTYSGNAVLIMEGKDAIVKTISEASKTIDYISSIKILNQRANINGNKISDYFVDIDLSFIIDRERP